MMKGMYPQVPRGLVSEEEFLSLPESHERIELIDGEVILGPSPTPRHQLVVSRLCRDLGAWADANPPTFVGLSPLDVRIGECRIVQPDVFLVLGGVADLDETVLAVPELIVEVMSTNRGHDRVTKRFIYAQAGVKEYWIVDPLARRIEVCHGLDSIDEHTDVVRSAVAAGLEISLADLFR